MVCLKFEKNKKWTPREIARVMHFVKHSRKLIELQLTVAHNIPPRFAESLMAKDLIRIVTGEDGKRGCDFASGEMFVEVKNLVITREKQAFKYSRFSLSVCSTSRTT